MILEEVEDAVSNQKMFSFLIWKIWRETKREKADQIVFFIETLIPNHIKLPGHL